MIRCSSLGKIMAEPKAKGEVLSVGAKTYLKGLARQAVYGYRPELRTKYTDKGLIVEDRCIELYNSVMLSDAVKNTERRSNGWLTGECDFLLPHKGVDIKASWSLETFPVLSEDCHDSDYEWQMRGYMILFDRQEWEVAFCMESTPPELIRFEQEDLHIVDHIPENLRVTTITYQRDAEKEARIETKCKAAMEYLAETIKRIKREHQEDES